jgi:predicted CopG family antitoxin
MGKTSVKVESETRDKLRSEKTGGETYDDVILRLLGDSDE